MDFTWDDEKAASNTRKHGVSFDDAANVFDDPFRVELFDIGHSFFEERWIAIGFVEPSVLFIVYAELDGDVIRIISARKANKDEQQAYYKASSRSL